MIEFGYEWQSDVDNEEYKYSATRLSRMNFSGYIYQQLFITTYFVNIGYISKNYMPGS